MSARPFFIVSSGRSGTAMLHKALSAVPGVEMHHEYMVQITQPLAVRRYLGLIDAKEAARLIGETYGGAIRYSDATHWGDSSNKLSWLIPDLAAAFPQARFVHLVRDGRKVASSYFHKLADECYDDRSTAILQAHVDDSTVHPAPPPEKKYWWPLPRWDSADAATFRGFSQFERICWHWAEINRIILAELAKLPADRTLFVRLEDLRAAPSQVRGLYEFLNLPYRDEAYGIFARPHNVNRPEDRLLDEVQRAQFDAIAGDMPERLGYAGRPEYRVNY
ncbi:MAG: sulfotransferase [Alphaproteobacteria bacterium]|nr:sulfotransferase [Alphaproteobacteria bacterium]